MGVVGARQILSFKPARLAAALLATPTPATSSPSGASLSGDDQGVGCGGGLQSWGGREKKLPSPHTGLITPPIATLAWAAGQRNASRETWRIPQTCLWHYGTSLTRMGPVCGEGCGCGLWLAIERLSVADL